MLDKMVFKAAVATVVTMTLLTLSSCMNTGVISAREARQQLNAFDMEAMADEVMAAIQAKDVEKLKSMMSANLIDHTADLDAELLKLINFIKGDVENYQYYDSGEQWTKTKKNYRIRNRGRIDIFANTDKYQLLFTYEVVNTYMANDKGICRLALYNDTTDEEGSLLEAPPTEFFGR